MSNQTNTSQPSTTQPSTAFAQSTILETIGPVRVAKFLNGFSDDFKAANILLPTPESANGDYFRSVATLLAASALLPDHLRLALNTLDGVPWNNNNAEHAIKSFVLLRRVIAGSTTEKGIREYLVLLSVCQTCKYMGVDFLDFLRSGEKDVHAFSESRRRRRRRTQGRQAIGQPTIREAAMTNGERPASDVQL